jgi:hypothetical protein
MMKGAPLSKTVEHLFIPLGNHILRKILMKFNLMLRRWLKPNLKNRLSSRVTLGI